MPADFLRELAATVERSAPAARELLASLGGSSARDIWLSWAPLDERESVLATAALAGGWVIFREPGESIHPATFAWARPTLASGDSAALTALAAGLVELAPRWGRERWLRRRCARLRAWIVTGGAPSAELIAALGRLAPAARVLPLPGAGW